MEMTSNFTDIKVLTKVWAPFLPSISQLEKLIDQANPWVWAKQLAPTTDSWEIISLGDTSFDYKSSHPSPPKTIKTNNIHSQGPTFEASIAKLEKLETNKVRFISHNFPEVVSPKENNFEDDGTILNRINTSTNRVLHSNAGVKKEISFLNKREKDDPDFLSSRCDVVYKTILRDFRRFYQNMFKADA